MIYMTASRITVIELNISLALCQESVQTLGNIITLLDCAKPCKNPRDKINFYLAMLQLYKLKTSQHSTIKIKCTDSTVYMYYVWLKYVLKVELCILKFGGIQFAFLVILFHCLQDDKRQSHHSKWNINCRFVSSLIVIRLFVCL